MQYKHDNKVNISTYKVNIQQRHVIKKGLPVSRIYICVQYALRTNTCLNGGENLNNSLSDISFRRSQ